MVERQKSNCIDYTNITLQQKTTLLYNKKDTGYHYVRGVERCTGRVIIDSVKILNFPITITGDTLICYGDTLKLLATSALTSAKYEWSTTTGGAFSPTPLSSGPTIIPEKSGNITVEITNDGICSKRTYRVEVIKLAVEADTISICGAGNSTIIHASGGTQYKWTPATFLDNDTIATPTCTPTSTITYSLKVSKGECSETFDVTITVDTPITVKANNDIYICNREFALLQAEGSPVGNYLWIPSSGLDSPTSSHPKANPISTTTYYVIGSNGSCKSIDSVTIFVINPIASNLEYSFDSCSRTFIGTQINATDSNDVVWDLGNGETRIGKSIRYQYPDGGNYTIQSFVNPLAPCIDSDAVQIYLPVVDAAKRRIPDAFSPNGDGLNDEFKIYFGNLQCAVKSFQIFNRWGQQVFEHQTGDALSWDGKLNGQLCETGIYVYYLKGDGFEDTGWIALIR
jgi:gliding motility-associated-like protein